MYQNAASKPATIDTVDQWIAAYHCNYDVVADPKMLARPPSGSIGMPYHVFINPRDMTVFAVTQGAGPSTESKLKELIALTKK